MLASMDQYDEKHTNYGRMSKALQKTSTLTVSEKHNVQTEIDVAEWNATKKLRVYSFIVVTFCMLAQMSSSWDRGIIAPAYQYNAPKSVNAALMSPYQHYFYFMSDVIGPPSNFALAAGLASATPLVFAGIFSGALAESCNRKNILGISIMAMALCTVAVGFATSFIQILILRFALGIGGGFFVPAVLGLIIDYFPEKLRT